MLIRPDEIDVAADYLATWSGVAQTSLITTDEAVEQVPVLKTSAINGAIYDQFDGNRYESINAMFSSRS